MSMQIFQSAKALAFVLITAIPSLAFGHGEEMHGNHDAKHGGFVMMFLEMHFELVVREEGGVQLYYSDPMRVDLPASVVADVTVEIEREGSATEPVPMMISMAGDFWEGESQSLKSENDIVRVGFLFQGEPFVLDIPAMVLPQFMDAPMPVVAESPHAGH